MKGSGKGMRVVQRDRKGVRKDGEKWREVKGGKQEDEIEC